MTVKKVTAKVATQKDLDAMKKELQKLVKEMRKETGTDFPKLSMGTNQMVHRTALVNLGFEAFTEKCDKAVKNNADKLDEFYKKWNIKTHLEYSKNSGGYLQKNIRLYY